VYQLWKSRHGAHHTPLTNNEIKAKPREKDFTLHDGDGLSCSSKPAGKKLWRFRYQRPVSKQPNQSELGHTLPTRSSSPDTRPAFNLLAQGMDPQQQGAKNNARLKDSIFSTVAANWFQIKSKRQKIMRKISGAH
jgi:hypothetical protein